MLTLRDCLDFCGLTDDQLDAIEHQKHLSAMLAAEWAECHDREGLKRVLEDELADARRRNDRDRVQRCRRALADLRLMH